MGGGGFSNFDSGGIRHLWFGWEILWQVRSTGTTTFSAAALPDLGTSKHHHPRHVPIDFPLNVLCICTGHPSRHKNEWSSSIEGFTNVLKMSESVVAQ